MESYTNHEYTKITTLLLAFMILCTVILLCACGKAEPETEEDSVNTTIYNCVEDRISTLSASWSLGGDTVGTTCVEVAGGGETLGKQDFTFVLNRDDVPKESKLKKLEIVVSVTETDGGTFEVARIKQPCKFGDEFKYELHYEDGCYGLWQVQ